jgi:glyoxylase-like metal-dependent hydrolase (beta-lactamase superfamily II)
MLARMATPAASSEPPFPPVERIRPGLWSIPVPLPIVLRYVFVYAFETDRGPYIVDAGWNTDEAFEGLSSGLAEAGFAIGDVQGVMVTHIHPDHYGLAGRIRDTSGAWIALHPRDAALIHDRYEEPEDLLERMGAWLRRLGAPADEIDTLRNASMPVRPFVEFAQPDVLLEDGDRPDIPGWDVTAIWTPGHSPGHLCFWDDANQLMLTGDCVLPRITPLVSLNPQAGDNPLGDYLESLARLGRYDGNALPAHEWRFDDLATRTRELTEHHEHRFAEVVDAIHNGFTTAWEIAPRMDWSRPWNDIDPFTRRAAIGEALAHLRALEVRGVVRENVGEPSHWEIVAS